MSAQRSDARPTLALLILALAFVPVTRAQPQMELMIDAHLSSEVGAENLLTLYDLTGDLEDKVLKPRLFEEDGFFMRTAGIAYRLGKLGFIDQFPVYFADVPQHEIFGHGFRARSFGYQGLSYHFSPPYPFGDGSAVTKFYPADSLPPTFDQSLAISSAGVEAEGVMARRLRQGWLSRGAMDYHGAYLYILSSTSIINYVANTPDTTTTGGNDMNAYLETLNAKEGYPLRTASHMTLNRLKNQSAVLVLDPMLWYAYWTLLKTYAWSGETIFDFPGIPLTHGWHYLPAMGYGLTPFGGEYLFDNLFWDGNRAVTLGLRRGQAMFHHFWGLNAEVGNLLAVNGYSLDATLRFWKQPPLALTPGAPAPASPGPEQAGFGGSVDVRSPPLFEDLPLRLAGGLGYKAAGFVPGERLDAGVMWRAGVAFTR